MVARTVMYPAVLVVVAYRAGGGGVYDVSGSSMVCWSVIGSPSGGCALTIYSSRRRSGAA